MTGNPEDHPRWQELWDAAIERGQLASIATRVEWEANERFRDQVIADTAADMRRQGVAEAEIEAMVDGWLNEPNEFWGEWRQGRRPRFGTM